MTRTVLSEDLKKKAEAVLFSAGRALSVEELARLCRSSPEQIIEVMDELQSEYNTHDSSLMVVKENNAYKLSVREKFLSVVRKIVTQTELSKTVMETLAVIAFKAPMLQSELIKIRTNKAYDHVAELENLGYISRTKHGRTKLVKLARKFFDYFDIPEEQLKEKFKSVVVLEHAIEEKQKLIEEKQEEFEAEKKKAKEKEEKHKEKMKKEHEKIDKELEEMPEIDIIDPEGHKHKLEVFETGRKVGELKVYGEEKVEDRTEEEKVEEEEKAVAERVEEMIAGEEVEVEEEPEEAKPEEEEKPAEEAVEEKQVEEKVEEEPEEERITPELLAKEAIEAAKEKTAAFRGKLFEKGMPKEVELAVEKRVEEIVTGKEAVKEEEEPPEKKEMPTAPPLVPEKEEKPTVPTTEPREEKKEEPAAKAKPTEEEEA